VGGIQTYLWELWRRLPAGDVTVLTTPYPGAAEFDRAQPFRVVRDRDKVLLPTPALARRIDSLAKEIGASLIFLDPALPLGALGPRMTELALGAADGLLVHPFTSDRHTAETTLPRIAEGLLAAGRDRADLTVVGQAILSCGLDAAGQAAADDGARWLVGFYGSTPAYRPVLDVEGWGEVQPELNRLSKLGQWAEMSGLITDEMVSTIAVHGTPEHCAAEIVRRYGDVSDRVCAYFPGYDISDELIAESSKRPAADGDDDRRRYYALTSLGRRVVAAEALRLRALVRDAEAIRLIDPEPA
jgi:hypothetical protein